MFNIQAVTGRPTHVLIGDSTIVYILSKFYTISQEAMVISYKYPFHAAFFSRPENNIMFFRCCLILILHKEIESILTY